MVGHFPCVVLVVAPIRYPFPQKPMSSSSILLPVLTASEQQAVPPNDKECNFQDVAKYYYDEDDSEEFVVSALGAAEESDLYNSVPYCAQWRKKSGLYLAKETLIKRAYEHKGELGLFLLFLNGTYLNCIRTWTSTELRKRGKRTKPLRKDELLAYLGLELAASLHRLNRLRDFWSSSDLLRNSFFKKVMGRDAFLNIRSALRINPAYDHDVACVDPLWHSRNLFEHFGRNAATLAFPVGINSLDENTVRCKARITARSYMKSKPVKVGIRFYAVVGWSHAYLHSFQDNGSGNRSGQAPVERYTKVSRDLRGAVARKIDGTMLPISSPSALWCAQVAYQTFLHPTQANGRLVVMDNFYKRHLLAKQLNVLSDNECNVLGTVRFNNVDGINRPALKEAIRSLKHARRGEWRLVQVYEKGASASDPTIVAVRTGFVVFKDRSVVSFYTNDLADTPSSRIHSEDKHSIKCVHGLAPLQRWTGTESLRRTTLQVPAVIVAYNLFMNGVDRFDQLRSNIVTIRRERRVTMSVLTFFLDASILNSHALLKAITPLGDTIIDIAGMKQRIVMQMVEEHVEYKQRRASLTAISAGGSSSRTNSATEVMAASPHVLLATVEGKRVHCVLCRLLSRSLRKGYTKYSCSQCKRGFYVNCFSLYHNKELLRESRPEMCDIIRSAEHALNSKPHRNRPNRVTNTLLTATLEHKT